MVGTGSSIPLEGGGRGRDMQPVTGEAPRRFQHVDTAGRSLGLQACRDAWRLAEDAVLLDITGADQLPNHD